jgi:hypothetical protein
LGRIKLFKNFTERKAFKPPIASAEGLFGGHCLGTPHDAFPPAD